jgi:hypothetical protein
MSGLYRAVHAARAPEGANATSVDDYRLGEVLSADCIDHLNGEQRPIRAALPQVCITALTLSSAVFKQTTVASEGCVAKTY